MRSQFIVMALCLFIGAEAAANDEAKEWMKFFEGNWTRERAVKTAEGEVTDVAEWSCKLHAGGEGAVSTGKWEKSGDSWVMLSSYKPGLFHYEHGVDSNGNRWSIEFKKVDKDTITGAAVGVIDGKTASGTVTLKRTSDNSYDAIVEIKDSDGKTVFSGIAKNKRR